MAVLATLVAATVLTGCSQTPETGDKGFVGADGIVTQLGPGGRQQPGVVEGETLEGKPLSLDDYAGKVVVVNVWGSWCPPCIEETPALQKAWETVQSKGKKVEFIGLDKLEGPETGLAFQTANKVTYPSLAYDGGVPILSLQGKASATPTTLVLDHQARIAARVSGPVSTTTLLGLIDDVLAEKA